MATNSLSLNKNVTYRNILPKNFQNLESKNIFSPIKVIKLPPNSNIQNIITNNNLQILNQNINIFPQTNLNLSNINKKTLVLDLDETLVHSSMDPIPNSDLTLKINVNGQNYNIHVLIRPYFEKFLLEMSYLYEIIIFTASLAEYAEALINIIDKQKIIKHILNRQHCRFCEGAYIKDLGVINRDIKDLIIIDNNAISYAMNKENGIPILSWYDDPNDN